MRTISGKQLTAIGRVFTDEEVPFDQVQSLIQSGLLADLRDANLDQIDRGAFRKMCGLRPLSADGFPIWKTVKLGSGLKTADDFRKTLTDAGFKIGDWANDILGKPAFTASETETEVDLVNVSLRDLGFKKDTSYKDVCAKAKQMGLALCPAEVGPQLRLQYNDQPKDEWIVVGMEPITDSDGRLEVFNVIHDNDGRWLRSYYAGPGGVYRLDDRFVFVRRK